MTEHDWHEFADRECFSCKDYPKSGTSYTFFIEDLKRFFFAVQELRDGEENP